MKQHESEHGGHHDEDPLVCYQVGIIFIVVLALIVIIGLSN